MRQDIEDLALELLSAYEEGAIIPVLPSSRQGFDLDAAYEVEATLKRLRESSGHRSVGRKVGYANKAVWRILKLETLVWAHMYEDTVHYSNNNSAALSLPHARSLKIEPEIVFGLKRAITVETMAAGNLDAAATLEFVDWLALGFEIIDRPFPGWQFQPSDFIASFGLHAALVVGEKIPVQPALIPELASNLAQCKVRMLKNGGLVEEGAGKNSLRSPALCLAELATAIVKRIPTEPLGTGEIISTGTLTAGHLVEKGDLWTAEVTGLAVPALTLRLN